MRLRRRTVLGWGGGMLAVLPLAPHAWSGGEVTIAMTGRADGSRVWFDPVGLRLSLGQTVRWVNRDTVNSHTATAYHPANLDRPRRVPEGADPWDSGYLLPVESFAVTLTVPGVYDYFCVPHEMSGMVGRIVVSGHGQDAFPDYGPGDLGPEAQARLPVVPDIVAAGAVRQEVN